MRPFSGGNDYSKNRISASPSKSYPTCSSLSSQTLSPRKSMEEVWKDINLPCLHDRPTTTLTNAGNHPAFPGMILQDFLGRPFSKDPSTTDHQHRPSSCVSHDRGNNDFLNSLLGPRPATMLSLNSASPDFQFLENTLFRKSNPPQLRSHRSSSSSLDALPSSSSSSLRTKRAKAQSLDNSTDQRNTSYISIERLEKEGQEGEKVSWIPSYRTNLWVFC
ncbi:hypothetical protein JCGZ_08178 [Jatropha curcas]|uniref:Uncharacterized protein n=1 Tax=Jatropha curcas TaxID=180498 RepID=A0A067KL81_JATCU|nr:hypothetical protein JCGZ_08178 [Jatropha curcas]